MKNKKTVTNKINPPPLNRFAGCSFLITFFVEFEIYNERERFTRTPSVISKILLRYSYE